MPILAVLVGRQLQKLVNKTSSVTEFESKHQYLQILVEESLLRQSQYLFEGHTFAVPCYLLQRSSSSTTFYVATRK